MRMQVLRVAGRLSVAVLAAVLSSGVSVAGIIAEWNFNGTSATTVPGGSLAPTPSTGTGTASLVGGVTAAASFGSGTANGGSSDPVIATPANYGWQTTTYPSQSTLPKTAGVQFNVSTLGETGISIEWDTRSSNTSARHQQFQYSLDGTTFNDFGSLFANLAGDTWFNNRSVDLSLVPGVDNNPNFAFRFVTAFDPVDGTTYTASGGGTYAVTGTLRFDMVTVSSVPEPSSLALFGTVGLVGLVVRRRTNRKS